MKSNPLIPELYVSDYDKSWDFYINVLGFKIEYQREKPLFAFISYNGSQIMIQELEPDWQTGKLEYPFGRGINFQIKTDNLDEILGMLSNIDWTIEYGPEINTYETNDGNTRVREFNVMDPDGYLLRFAQTLNPTE